MGLDLRYVLNRLAGTSGLPEGRALDAAFAGRRLPVAWYKAATGAQSIPANTWTRLTIATKIHLDGGYFSFNATDNKIVVSQPGLYLVMGRSCFDLAAGGVRYLRTRVEGAAAGTGQSYFGRVNDQATSDSNELSDTHYIDLVAGQSVAIDGYTTAAGTARNSESADEVMKSQLQVIRLSSWSTEGLA